VLVARPPAGPPARRDLHLVRAARRTFTGSAEFLGEAGNRARVGEYLADMARPYGLHVPATLFSAPPSGALGHSYGEMAQALIGPLVPADEPVGLLVLAFSVHDLRPGRQTAAYLSHVTPGAPMAFAICDQGCAAAFSGLRIAGEYVASAGIGRALLVVVEQAALPYPSPGPVPAQHQGIAMLYADAAAAGGDAAAASETGAATQDRDAGAMTRARVVGVRQHPGVPAAAVADLAAAGLSELAAGQDQVSLVLSSTAAAVWATPAAGRVRVMPPGQPSTGVWWGLLDELSGEAGQARPGFVVAADYDPHLRYLCLTAFDLSPAAPSTKGSSAPEGKI
jgi:hypothetical protein